MTVRASARSRWTWVPWGTSAGVFVLLMLSATSYGWHRDELYFVVAGMHPDWAYPDQPPLTPLLAAAADGVGGLVAVRLVAALLAAGLPLLAAATARELGASSRARGLAAIIAAAGPLVLTSGHLLSTTAVDLVAAAAVTWLFLRALRTGEDRWLVLVGVVTAAGILNKLLLVIVPAILVVGLLLVGPRAVLRRRGLWIGAGIAALASIPVVVWQANHGWPQVEMASQISARWDAGEFVFIVLAVLGLLLLPIAVAGLVALLRGSVAPSGRGTGRFVAVAWLVLVAVMLATRGKAYYTAGLVPALVAAGSVSVDAWLTRGRRVLRAWGLGVLVALQAAISIVVALPVVPVGSLAATPIPAINGESVETIGWDTLVTEVGRVSDGLPPAERAAAVILTANYGEAGALIVLGGDDRLPVYSGHNGFGEWGPPGEGAAPVIAVGFRDQAYVDSILTGCRTVAVIDNGYGLENEEQGAPVQVCSGPVGSWAEAWPRIRHLN